jgi:hypothetical protein
MERQPNAFGIESDHSSKMKPMRLYQHPQVSLDIADPPSAVMVPKQLLCRVGRRLQPIAVSRKPVK